MMSVIFNYVPILLGFVATIIALKPSVRDTNKRLTGWGYSAILIAIIALLLEGWIAIDKNKQEETRKEQAIETILLEMAPQRALFKYHIEIGIVPPPETNEIIKTMTSELEKKFQLHYEYLSDTARVRGQTTISNQTIVSLLANDPNKTAEEFLRRIVVSYNLQKEFADILCIDAKNIGSDSLCKNYEDEWRKLYRVIETSMKSSLPQSVPKINKVE